MHVIKVHNDGVGWASLGNRFHNWCITMLKTPGNGSLMAMQVHRGDRPSPTLGHCVHQSFRGPNQHLESGVERDRSQRNSCSLGAMRSVLLGPVNINVAILFCISWRFHNVLKGNPQYSERPWSTPEVKGQRWGIVICQFHCLWSVVIVDNVA